jgi:hypothetical protein
VFDIKAAKNTLIKRFWEVSILNFLFWDVRVVVARFGGMGGGLTVESLLILLLLRKYYQLIGNDLVWIRDEITRP